MMKARWAVCILVLGSSAAADQDPRRIARDWRIQYERNPIATFVGFERDKVILRRPDGSQRNVELWMLEGRELAYLQRQRCALPKTMRQVALPSRKNLLVDLSADSLPVGKLARWPNRGALGGAFHAMATPPVVDQVAGRRAVRFDYGPAIVSMDVNTMVADCFAPKGIVNGESFSVVAWLYNPGVPTGGETFLSWHTLGGDDGTDVRFGKRGRHSFIQGAYAGPMGTMGFPRDDLGGANAWHHVAHVFTGGGDGEMRLYLDGTLVGRKVFERTVRISPATAITAGSARLGGRLFLREDKAVAVRFYVGRRDGHTWTRVYPNEPDRWNRLVEVSRSKSGPVSVAVDGLKPGTDYVYRIQVVADDDHIYWSDGTGRFRTAGADGTAGQVHPKQQRRHLFLGSSWGSTWDWTTTPRYYYTGAIGSLKVYDHPLTERQVRRLWGSERAYAPSPADAETLAGLAATLRWKPGADGVEGYRVYLGRDRAAVAAGRKETLRGQPTAPSLDAGKLEFASTYHWRVDEVTAEARKVIGGDVWSFSTPDGRAAEPNPADGATGVNVQSAYFTWKPGGFAREQTVYLDTDRKAVADGTARHTIRRGGRDGNMHWPWKSLEYGRTYFWRVAARNRDSLPESKGGIWSFTVEDFFEPEHDGVVSQPYPKGVRQWGRVTKFMEGGGHPILAADDTPDLAMRRARKTCLKVLEKRPDLHYRLAVSNTAGSLDHKKELGWTEMVRNTYGATRNMLLDQNFYGGANMLMHEMGHQLHMNGMSQLELDFDHRLHEAWLAAMKSGKYLGHYGSNNMWEYIACAANLYINDGHRNDEVYPRERLRRDDPRLYFLLNEFWSGDRRIELNAHEGVTADRNGVVRQWANAGGVEFWGRQGWSKYPGTVGTFKAVGRPALATVGGVSAVRLSGKDALVWSRSLRPAMAGDREWSVEFWAWKDRHAGGEEVLLSWGKRADGGGRFLWGSTASSYDHGPAGRGQWRSKPAVGAWQHVAFVYEGGGEKHEAGRYRVYVNGALDHQAPRRLDLAPGAAVVVGGVLDDGRVRRGFSGALAHVRLYDYDMHPLQVADHHARERAYYVREETTVAGRLLVDLDARRLEACPVRDHRPLYPRSLNRPWVRSWVNRGTLGGKVHNNVWRQSGSTPLPRTIDGVRGVAFRGKDSMVSGVPRGQVGTVEAWVRVDRPDTGGTLLELAGCRLRSDLVAGDGWHHVAAVRGKDAVTVFVDGRRTDRRALPATCRRLHLGAHWDGWRWTDCLDGAIAQVRVHSGVLSDEQVLHNSRASDFRRAADPRPADGAAVVASRKPALRWEPAASGAKAFELYFGIDREAVATAERGSAVCLGRARPGQRRPKLEPGRTYWWRVDALDENGRLLGRGRAWRFRTYRGAVIDLDAAALKSGKVARWPNRGAAGGGFVVGQQGPLLAPTVRAVQGRKGADFMGDKLLRSSFPAPAGITGGSDFSVVVRMHDPKTWQTNVGVLLSVGARPERTLEFGIDFGNSKGAFRSRGLAECGFESEDLSGRAWHDIVWTYAGATDKTFRVYVDGRLNTEKAFKLQTASGGRITLGAAATAGAPADRYRGLISAVRVYDHALSQEEVQSLHAGRGKKPDPAKLLVDLDAAGLPEGKLSRWPNRGTLGGHFGLTDEPDRRPTAQPIAGRPAVSFDGKETLLRSEFPTPQAVTGPRPFTVEAWVHNPSVQHVETVFALAPAAAKRTFMDWQGNGGVECNYGRGGYNAPSAFANGTDGFNIAWHGAPPKATGWRHLAWVYSGGRFGSVRVYADDRLNAIEEHVSLDTYSGFRMVLGAGWNTRKGLKNPFSGAVNRLTVFDYARTAEEIQAAARR